ncbi:MAG: hydrogenase nickel incorporation protein HypB [Candidatus Sumerlaeia bacterium]
MKIPVVENVLKVNDAVARDNRRRLEEKGIRVINMMSAPGSGKTTLLQKTIPALRPDIECAVLVGDLQTTRDAERLEESGAQVVQINTGRGCHLDAAQVSQGIDALDLDKIDLLFIENVGNMVCPAGFDLGEHSRAILLSIPEGDDKIAKYPTLFQPADVVLLSKIDLLGVLECNRETIRDDLAKLNAKAPFIEISTKSGHGMDQWLEWLRGQLRAK